MPLTEADLLRYITDGDEESLTLDYKAAGALAKTDGKKTEITKDVSAMANAAGGRIIYGIRECSDPSLRHRPEALAPVDRREISKEWLDQVIGSVRPRIDGVVITPVPLSYEEYHVAYVVDVPQSTTAHQASDKRYYRRYNFESVAMYDHEIRDVMARSQHPLLSLSFEVSIETIEYGGGIFPTPGDRRSSDVRTLHIWAANEGQRFARYVNGFVQLPVGIVADSERGLARAAKAGTEEVFTVHFDNTRRDIVGTDKNPIAPRPLYGPSWFDPILPGLRRPLKEIELDEPAFFANRSSAELVWSVYADNAPVVHGRTQLLDVPISDRR